MSDVKAPKVTIAAEREEETFVSAPDEAEVTSTPDASAPTPEPDVPKTTVEPTDESSVLEAKEPEKPKAFMAWLSMRFPGHEHAVLGGFFGLFAALLIFSLGLFRALVVLLLIVIGIAVGQYLDGDPRLIGAIRRLLGNDRT